MASAFGPEMESKEAGAEFSESTIHTFDAFAMRGFGNFDNSLGVVVYSDVHEGAPIRAPDGRSSILFQHNSMYPIVARLDRPSGRLPMRGFSTNDISRRTSIFGDFAPVSMGVPERSSAAKGKFEQRRRQPESPGIFRECDVRQLLWIRDVYGARRIAGRAETVRFLFDLGRGQPDLFKPSCLFDTWEGVNADYGEIVKDAARRITQVLEVAAYRLGCLRMDTTPRDVADGGWAMWRVPETFKIRRDAGYWGRATLPHRKIDYKRTHLHDAVGKYMENRTSVDNKTDLAKRKRNGESSM